MLVFAAAVPLPCRCCCTGTTVSRTKPERGRYRWAAAVCVEEGRAVLIVVGSARDKLLLTLSITTASCCVACLFSCKTAFFVSLFFLVFSFLSIFVDGGWRGGGGGDVGAVLLALKVGKTFS